jgi:small subunit ribosomal protein S6e
MSLSISITHHASNNSSREITRKSGKTYTKAPAIQRLVTPQRLQRARHLRSLQKRKTESQKESVAEYKAKLSQHAAEKKEHNAAVKAAKKSKRCVSCLVKSVAPC